MLQLHSRQASQTTQNIKQIKINSNINFFRSHESQPFIEDIQPEPTVDDSQSLAPSLMGQLNPNYMLNLNHTQINTQSAIQYQVQRLSEHE